MRYPYLDVIRLHVAAIFVYTGQAFFTSRYTPDLVQSIQLIFDRFLGAWSTGLLADIVRFSPHCTKMLIKKLRDFLGLYTLISSFLLLVPETSDQTMEIALVATTLAAYATWLMGWTVVPLAIMVPEIMSLWIGDTLSSLIHHILTSTIADIRVLLAG